MSDGPSMELLLALLEIQHALKCDKAQYNSFGGFNYRSKEDILEAAKPLAYEHGCLVLVDDDVMEVGGKNYIKAKASLVLASTGASVSATGISREADAKKGMDASQLTGVASSYAGKRALGNLFALDDTKDADAEQPGAAQPPSSQVIGRCTACNTQYTFQSVEQMGGFFCPCGGTFEAVR